MVYVFGIWFAIAVWMGVWACLDMRKWRWRFFIDGFRFAIGLPFAALAGVFYILYTLTIRFAEWIGDL